MKKISILVLLGWLAAPIAFAQTTGRPPMLALSTPEWDSSIPFENGDAIEAYADARDSFADLQALGWTVRRVAAVSCANGTENDFAAIQAAIDASTSGTVIYLDDARATPCNYNGPSSSLRILNKSDVMIVGRGMNETILRYDVRTTGKAAAVTAGIAGMAQVQSISATWTAGFSAGTSSVTISDSANAIQTGTRLLLGSADPDGERITHTSVVSSISGSGSRRVVLADPLPVDFSASATTVQIYNAKNTSNGWVENVGLMDLTVDQTGSSRVSDTAANSPACIQGGSVECPWFGIPVVEFQGVRHARLERVRIPHTFNVFVRLQGGATNGNSDHGIFRGNRFDELYFAYNRANNNSAWAVGSPNSNGHYFANNVIGNRVGRFLTYEAGGVGGVAAWNYQMTQEPIGPVSETTCDVINSRGGFGRSIFFHGGGGNTSGILIEGNDLHCHVEMEGRATDFGRRLAFYRNRMVRPSTMGSQWGGWISTSAADTVIPRVSMLFNRTLGLDSRSGGGAFAAGAGSTLRMWYNAAETSCVLGSSTSQGGCSATNSNPGASFVGNVRSASAVSAATVAEYPPSLVLSSAPSWWCQEACAWSDTSYGASESRGVSMCKLPAQIRAEGRACTPVGGFPAPVFLP